MKKTTEAYFRVTTNHITYNSLNAEKSGIRRFERKFISLIIVLYFGIVVIQCLPPGPVRVLLKPYTEPIILLFGLKQRWNLFSPDIREMNQFATAQVTFKDGAVKLYEWPENRKFSFHEGIERLQLRKFMIDGVNEPLYNFYWPASARFIALCNSNPENPPVYVQTTFNGFNVSPFSKYARQDQINLRTPDCRTPHLFLQVNENHLKPGLR